MSLAADINIKFAMQAVSLAVQLDSEGRLKDAYQKYLECIQQMASFLSIDASRTEVYVAPTSKQLVSLCQNCIDRVSELMMQLSNQKNDDPQTSTLQEKMNFLQKPSQSSPQPPTAIQLAQTQNDKLLTSYMARIKLVDKQVAANLSLSVQRKMAENLAIAKQRQQALEKKRNERLERLMKETERRFGTRPEMSADEMERRKIYTKILEYEQDVKWLLNIRRAMSTMHEDCDFIRNTASAILRTLDHPLSELMLEYQRRAYQLITDAKEELQSITLKDESEIDVSSLDLGPMATIGIVSEISAPSVSSRSELSISSSSQAASNDSVDRSSEIAAKQPTISQKSTDISHDVALKLQQLVERLEVMFLMTYEQLNTNCQDEQVYCTLRSTLEVMFYGQLWPHVTALYRLANVDVQQSMAAVMSSHANVSAEYLGVSAKLAVTDSGVSVPFSSVVDVLKTTPEMVSPLMKLKNLSRCLHMICECVNNYFSSRGSSSPEVGADELLPILCFVIIKTQRPELAVDCYALMDFIDERDLKGEIGYCLASVLTAITYLLTLSS